MIWKRRSAPILSRAVSKFVQTEQIGGDVLFELGFEAVGSLGGNQVVDRIDCGGEEDGVAALAGLVAQGDGKMGFTEADTANEHGIGLLGEEPRRKRFWTGAG